MALNKLFVTVLVFGLQLISVSRADDAPGLKLGKMFEGRIGGEIKLTPGVTSGGEISTLGAMGQGYQSSLTVKLKAKQGVLISVNVINEKRKVHVILRDRTGTPVAVSKIEAGSTTLRIKRIADTGNHTVEVVSDRVGDFTLLVTDEEPNEKELEERIAELEQQIKELKVKLKEKQDKKP